jgi:hypothetical protein
MVLPTALDTGRREYLCGEEFNALKSEDKGGWLRQIQTQETDVRYATPPQSPPVAPAPEDWQPGPGVPVGRLCGAGPSTPGSAGQALVGGWRAPLLTLTHPARSA